MVALLVGIIAIVGFIAGVCIMFVRAESADAGTVDTLRRMADTWGDMK